MDKKNDIRQQRHCVSNMHVNLVFVTKCRRDVFTKALLDARETILSNVCKDVASERLAFDGEHDPVHRLVNDSPKVAVSHLANSLQNVSSRLLRKQNHPRHQEKTVGQYAVVAQLRCRKLWRAPIAVIRKDIEQQQTPHAIAVQDQEGKAFRAIHPLPERGDFRPKPC